MFDAFLPIADPGTRRRLAPDAEPETELLPEQRLVLAVILRALMDAGVQLPGMPRKSSAAWQREARAWLRSDDAVALCELVGLDVARVRGLMGQV